MNAPHDRKILKPRLPLGLKLSVWLMLNLALLAALSIGAFSVAFGLRWESFIAGSAGNRLRALVTTVISDLRFVDESERSAFLEAKGRELGLQLYLVRNERGIVLGATPDIPNEVVRKLEFHAPPGAGLPLPPPPWGATSIRFQDRLRPRGPGFGPLFITFSGSPAPFWIGIRTHVETAEGNYFQPAFLLIRVPTLWALTRVFDLMIWVWVGLSALGISILFWWPIVRGLNRSIRTLAIATERVADGNFNTRVAIDRRDELGLLSESVNRMTERLERVVSGHRRFLSDAAHEIGSPLGRLQMAVTILEEHAQPDLRPAIQDVREEVQLMSRLIEELLVYSRATSGPDRLAKQSVFPLEAIAKTAIGREDRHHRVQWSVDGGLRIMGDARLLERAIANLVRNALRYAPTGAIELRAHAKGDEVFLQVDDEGPGVAPAFLQRLGEPFFRPDDARTREDGGTGLGLAIVKAAALACDGSVTFSNREPRGFRAELRLRRAPAATGS